MAEWNIKNILLGSLRVYKVPCTRLDSKLESCWIEGNIIINWIKMATAR